MAIFPGTSMFKRLFLPKNHKSYDKDYPDYKLEQDYEFTDTHSAPGIFRSLRQEVLEFGFESYCTSFDPAKVLISISQSTCTYEEGQVDVAEIYFFHREGMAYVFGTGMSFSKVVVRPNLLIEIEEVESLTWEKVWDHREGQRQSVVILMDATGSTSVEMEDGSKTSGGNDIFIPESLAQFNGKRIPLYAIWNIIAKCFGDSPSRIRSATRGHPGAELGNRDHDMREERSGTGKAPSDLEYGETIARAKVDEIKVRIPLEGLLKSDPEKLMIIQSTLAFTFYRTRFSDDIFQNNFNCDIDVKYKLNGIVFDADHKFGWIHDHFRVSFKCTEDDGVDITHSDVFQSTQARRFQGEKFQTNQNCDEIQAHQVDKNGDEGVNGKEEFELMALEKSLFVVSEKGSPTEQACEADALPSLREEKLWNMEHREDRDRVRDCGMMSSIPFKMHSKWCVRPPHEAKLLSIYNFSSSRSLFFLMRRSAQTKTSLFSKSTRSFVYDHFKSKQELRKEILINHSFSHLEAFIKSRTTLGFE